MPEAHLPPWQNDVHRALKAALSEYSAALDGLEIILLNNNTGGDFLAAQAAIAAHTRRIDSARRQLRTALKLARSRIADADADVHAAQPAQNIPLAEPFAEAVDAHQRRSAALGDLLRKRMRRIAEEIGRRRKLRPNRPIFRDPPPAHIDLHL